MTRPLAELSSSGLLWLINRSVFHPRGFALGVAVDNGKAPFEPEGWFINGNGMEPFVTNSDTDDEKFMAAERTLYLARRAP